MMRQVGVEPSRLGPEVGQLVDVRPEVVHLVARHRDVGRAGLVGADVDGVHHRTAEIARRDGILALENKVEAVDDPFLVNGIKMAVDGSDPEVIERIAHGEPAPSTHRR